MSSATLPAASPTTILQTRHHRPKLVAPAGNFLKLQTAVRYGADAVYLAGLHFGLRSGSENFTDHALENGIRFAHAHGCAVYVVLNGFLFDEEIERLPDFLRHLAACEVDAVVVSDLGVMETVRRHSDLRIHLSTQASCTNAAAARMWKAAGVSRIVLARELSIREGAAIRAEADIEVEMFVHGATCMAYSGNCVISNYTAGRDSNRGGCKQSCRFDYAVTSDTHSVRSAFMSSPDLIGLDYVSDLAAAGIDALKIEGRMKSPLYTAATVRAYRRVLNHLSDGTMPDIEEACRRDLESFSHREYSAGNLPGLNRLAVADAGSPPDSGNTGYLGYVVEESANGGAWVRIVNPFAAGEPVEWLEFDGGSLMVPANPQDLNGDRLPAARANTVVRLDSPVQPCLGMILRRVPTL